MNLINTQFALTPRIVRAGEQPPVEWGGGFRGACLLPSPETGGAFSLLAGDFDPNRSAPLLPRLHTRENVTCYIREGRFIFRLGDQTIVAGPGDCVFAPRGVEYAWQPDSNPPGGMAILITPGSSELETNVTQHAPIPKSDVFPALSPAFVPAGSGVRIEVGSYRDKVLLNAEQTAGLFTLFDREFMPGSHVPPHIHSREEETFYLLEGRLRIQIGEQITEVEPGDCVFAPRHVIHGWNCISDVKARALAFVTPGANFEGFFHAMGQRTLDPSDPSVLSDLITLCARYGIEMLPPAMK